MNDPRYELSAAAARYTRFVAELYIKYDVAPNTLMISNITKAEHVIVYELSQAWIAAMKKLKEMGNEKSEETI